MFSHSDFNPLIVDIQEQYKAYRTTGKTRAEAVALLKDNYETELQDEDDSVAVMIGLSLALGKKRELTPELVHETRSAIQQFREQMAPDREICRYLAKTEAFLDDETRQGNEAAYRVKRFYAPDWAVGDTFCHTLTHPRATALGIEGWFILFCKVGEYMDWIEQPIQLMYVTLCPPGELPQTSAQLQALGILRMMRHDETWDYLAQLTIQSKRGETAFALSKIGNFPDIVPPEDRTVENPQVSMPLFSMREKGEPWPAYEDQICRLYRRNGMYTPPVTTSP